MKNEFFNLKNKQLIKSCKLTLSKLYRENKRIYIELFFHEKDIIFEKFDLGNLVKVGILKKLEFNKYRALKQVFPLSGKFICTDFIISFHKIRNRRIVRGRDDVWGILPYESPYIAKKTIVEKNDFVLDLATGSGIIAIFCAEKAKKIIATDINPKAINYAKFNAILNDLEDKIEFRVGNMFEPVGGLKFDLIIWNGPTVSTPNAPEKYPIYCFGGPAGNNFTRKFIEEAPKYLTKKGKMQWIEASLGTKDEPFTISYIKKKWKFKKFRIICEERVEPDDLFKVIAYTDKRLGDEPLPGRPITSLEIKQVSDEEHDKWINFLKSNDYTHIHALMMRVYPSKKFEITKTKPKEILFKRMNYIQQEWHFLGTERILQLLKVCETF